MLRVGEGERSEDRQSEGGRGLVGRGLGKKERAGYWQTGNSGWGGQSRRNVGEARSRHYITLSSA